MQFKDSIRNRTLANFSDVELKYQNEKKQKKLLIKEQKLKLQEVTQQKLTNYIVFLTLISIFFILFFSYYYIMHKKAKDKLTSTLQEIKK